MKIAFIASLYEKEQHQFHYLAIVDLLEALGHQVLHSHLTEFDLAQITQSEKLNSKFHRQIFQALKAADFIVAEVSSQSLVVGFLIAEALRAGKPVLALTANSIPPITSFLEESEMFAVHQYAQIRELERQLPSLLSQVEPKKERKFNFFLPPELDEYLLTTANQRRLSKSEYLRQLLQKDQLQPPLVKVK
jgi:hypothetical protein